MTTVVLNIQQRPVLVKGLWARGRFGRVSCRGNVLVYAGYVENGTIILTQPTQLPDGVQVRVEMLDDLFWRGFHLFESRPDKHWSLTDCTSFVIMEEHGMTEALTADHHFQQAGFTALLC